ncbi:MAG TPA: Uma2 family endonuclease [Pirellulales bacterium]|jgi:Uma2 family endonuclease|nr:Uma2 family endonuclease [Pirellulales bacterium]
MATRSDQSQFPPFGGPSVQSVPPLETGDSLSLPEFERRYEAMPWLKNAELINGVVYVGSPVSEPHAAAHAYLMTWLGNYRAHTPGIGLAANATVRLDAANEVQPDALVRLLNAGQSLLGQRDYIEGPPELVAEIAATTASRDMHLKRELYRRHGVHEYLVWRVFDRQMDWFQLEGGDYRPIASDNEGAFRSRVFPGLWLDWPAMLRGDLAAVLAGLARGLASPEHAQFVANAGA